VGELKAALAVEVDDEQSQPKRRVPNFEAAIRQCCGSLIDIDMGNKTVRLIHASVKDFLLNEPPNRIVYASLYVDAAVANAYIAQCCLTYLFFEDIDWVDVNDDRDASLSKLDDHIATWELLNYAAVNWNSHHLSSHLTNSNSPQLSQSLQRLCTSDQNTI
jgi:hypothetical protein